MSNGNISPLTAVTDDRAKSEAKAPIFLTLGMHRSGTSVLARGLASLGVSLGTDLLGPSEGDNEKGFWEDTAILELEDRVLKKAGSTFDVLAPITQDFTGPPFSEERVEASELIRRRMASFERFGFKNPRSALLLDFWQCIFEDLGVEARYSIAIRNPLEVAKSLKRRNGFAIERSLFLWAKYCISIVEKTENATRVFVNYDRLVERPEEELNRLALGLNLSEVESNSAAIDEFASDFLDDKLKHFSISPSELRRDPSIPDWVIDLYYAMRELGDQSISDGVFPKHVLDRAKAGYDAITPVLRMFDQTEMLRADAAERLGRSEHDFELQVQELEDLRAKVQEHEPTITDLQSEISRLKDVDQRMRDLEDQLDNYVEIAGEQKLQLDLAKCEVERLSVVEIALKESNEIVAKLEGERSHLDEIRREEKSQAEKSISQLEAKLAALRNTKSAFEQLQLKNAQQEQAIHSFEAERIKLEGELRATTEHSQAEQKSLQAVIERLQNRTLNLSDSAAGLEAELAHSIKERGALNDRATSLALDVANLKQKIVEKHQDLETSRRLLKNAAVERGQYAESSAEKSRLLKALEHSLSDAENQTAHLEQQLRSSQSSVIVLSNELSDSKAELHEFLLSSMRSRAEVRALRSSRSWKVSAPLRRVGAFLRAPRMQTQKLIKRTLKTIWHLIPGGPLLRGKLAKAVVLSLPMLFGRTALFRAFKEAEVDVPNNSSVREQVSKKPIGPHSRHTQYQAFPAKNAPSAVRARALAFYLPQFHAIPENDEWWGEGFTEWTKVKPATPKFEGHYQPHVPGELGYYDLRSDPKIMKRQAELARLHGLSGFCFYFYWFGGKTLLETPIENYLQDESIEFPYCLCWANENWSRRWDGRDEDILIQQDHSPADDFNFIKHISKYLKDPRYTRVDGRPLLLVYRPSLLPDAKATVARWREYARQSGIGDLYLAYTQSFESEDPAMFGFDAAIEFPPNNSGLEPDSALIAPSEQSINLKTYDWNELVRRSENYPRPNYKIFRGVTPSWDNTPRRPTTGAVMLGGEPSKYGRWLENAILDTQARFSNPDEQLIFINAWNEWAEGAHLEPDQHFGYAWLHSTRSALAIEGEILPKKIIVVAHDLHKHGAQYLSLNMLRTLKNDFGFEVAAIAGGDGALADEFRALGTLDILDRNLVEQDSIDATISQLKARGFHSAIVNSCASGWIAPHLSNQKIRSVGLVHELPEIINDMKLHGNLRAMDEHCDHVVFAAEIVRDQSGKAAGLQEGWSNPIIMPQGLYKSEGIANLEEKEDSRIRVSEALGISRDSRFVLGVGYGDYRKGLDIFVDWAIASVTKWPDVHFVWLGGLSADMRAASEARLKDNPRAASNIHFPGFVDNTFDFYLASDVYALSSREDPFPSTALEALNAATPVVMVAGCSGIEDLAESAAVTVIPTSNARSFVDAAGGWLESKAIREAAGLAGREKMQAEFGFVSFIGGLLDYIDHSLPSISVVVPNFNYARFIEQRLQSILQQTLPPRELIFLDDGSSDESVSVAKEVLRNSKINVVYDLNTENSGSVFAQWKRGVERSTGEYVWIAEADDWADLDFLKVTARAFELDGMVMAYAQSNQVDQTGSVLAKDYLDYVRDIDAAQWRSSYIRAGHQEAAEAMSVKNVAPNVSGMLFKRDVLLQVLQEHESELQSYRVAGDWFVYANLLQKGDVAFFASSLNYHRRHSSSVTISRFSLSDLAEIARMQLYVREHFNVPDHYARKAEQYLDKLIMDFDLKAKYSSDQIDQARRGITS